VNQEFVPLAAAASRVARVKIVLASDATEDWRRTRAIVERLAAAGVRRFR